MVCCARFFCFIPNYGSSGACPQKMSHFGLRLTIWWPKPSSVIEKVKPHRARILFVNDNFSNNHCSKHTPYTCKGHSNSSPACVYCIFDIWNCLGNINTNCKISLNKLTFKLVQIAHFHSLGCTPLTQSAFK